MIFKAEVEFISDERHGASHTITYRDDEMKDAIRSAIRWAKNRIQTLEEYKEIAAIKIKHYMIHEISEGQLNTFTSLGFFEWKYDWGCTLEDQIKVFKKQKYRKGVSEK